MNSTPITYTARCADGSCAHIEENIERGGFELTSTISPEQGSVFYTYGEMAQLIADVKAGDLDVLEKRAMDNVGTQVSLAG